MRVSEAIEREIKIIQSKNNFLEESEDYRIGFLQGMEHCLDVAYAEELDQGQSKIGNYYSRTKED